MSEQNALQEKLEKSEARNRLNDLIAITVAILSVFMGITKIKDDNIVQALLQAKSDTVDTWNEYQAKKLKHHMAELGINQVNALKTLARGANVSELASQEKQYREAIARYQADEAVLMNKAKAFEKMYDDLNFKDDQFDLSDGALSIALAMLAISALTGRRALLALAWLFTIFGLVMGLSGLLGLSIHPTGLIKLLS